MEYFYEEFYKIIQSRLGFIIDTIRKGPIYGIFWLVDRLTGLTKKGPGFHRFLRFKNFNIYVDLGYLGFADDYETKSLSIPYFFTKFL